MKRHLDKIWINRLRRLITKDFIQENGLLKLAVIFWTESWLCHLVVKFWTMSGLNNLDVKF